MLIKLKSFNLEYIEMQPAKKFTTKTGYCHVLEDRIVFTPRSFIGRLGDLTIQGRMKRILLVFTLLALFILYLAYENYRNNEIFWAGLFGVIGGYLIYGIIKGLNTSMHPIIQRAKIEKVKLRKAIQGISPANFEITFRDAKGAEKKRIITLLSPIDENRLEIQNAMRIMRDEGYID